MTRRIRLTLVKQTRGNRSVWRGRWRDRGRYRFVNIATASGTAAVARREAEALLAAAEDNLNRDAALSEDGPSMTLRDWARKYVEIRRKDPTIGEDTSNLDDSTLVRLVRWLPAGILLRDVTPSMLDDWRIAMLGEGLSESTVHGHFRRVRAMFERAIRRKIADDNPAADVKVANPPPSHFTPELSNDDCLRLVDAADSENWKAMVALCAFAGLRAGEAQRVRWADVSWSRGDRHAGRITVTEKDGRVTTKSRRREVYLEPMLERILLDIFNARSPRLDHKIVSHRMSSIHRKMSGYTDKQSGKRYSGIIERAGFVPWNGPMQALRRRREEIWIEVDGRDENAVMSWMGHSKSVSRRNYRTVSERHYAVVSPSQERDLEIAAMKKQLRGHLHGVDG